MPVRMTKEGRASSREEYRYEKKEKAKKEKFLSGGQAKIAAKAPPPNKIDEKDFAVLRAEKAKGRGMGLQDESVKPGKVMKANLGLMFMKQAKKKGAKGLEFLSPLAMLKRISGKKVGGVAKYKKGSGLDLPVISSVKPTVNKSKRAQNLSEMKIQFNKQKSRMGKNPNTKKFSSMAEMRAAKGFKPGESASNFNKRRLALNVAKKAASATTVGKIALGVAAAGVAASQYLKGKMKKDKNKKTLKDFREQKKPGVPSEKTKTINSALNKLKAKKMGGGMMQRPMGNTMMQRPMMQQPMGYNTGGFKSKQDRKKAEKNIKQARSKEGLKSFLSSGNKINQPMRKERYMEGRKARHTEFKKKIGRTALGIASSLNPVTSIAKGIGKVMGKGSKKRDFQKGDYGDISVKKNMGGMMMQRPMGYKYGTSVKAKCKLGRNKATKIT